MKKNGFTLAEVLITLAIIGVVATMTLPTLMTNTGEQQYKTGLKKGINILTEAAQMHQALEGCDYATLTATSDAAKIDEVARNKKDEDGNDIIDEETGKTVTEEINGLASFAGLLLERTKIDTKTTKALNETSPAIKTGGLDSSTLDKAIVFTDGTAIIFNEAATIESGEIKAIFDTNGAKKPNLLSNCKGELAGADDSADADSDPTNCEDKTKRVIRDQFQITLEGTVVRPLGAAATWTLTN